MHKNTFTLQKPLRQIGNYRLSLLAIPCAFVLGIFGAQNSELSLVVIALVIGLLIIRAQFRNKSMLRTTSEAKMHWPTFFFPMVLSLSLFSRAVFILVLVLLVGATFLEKNRPNIQLNIGPLVLLFASTVITFRTLNPRELIVPLLLFALIFRLIATVKSQDLVSSIVNGYGFFCLINVVAHYMGLTSPNAIFRTGGLIESSGFSRVIFPFSESVNSLPALAAFVCLAMLLSHRDSINTKTSIEYAYLISSFIILIKSGNRSALIILIVVTLVFLTRYRILRITALWVTPFAIVSSVLLTSLATEIGKITAPILSVLTPGRNSQNSDLFTFQGRSLIWEASVNFWQQWVNDPFHQFFGYGQNGQYISGASQTYSYLLKTISLSPELGSVHNSFLQQLFDGGLIGVLLLATSLVLSFSRISKRLLRVDFHGLLVCTALITLTLFGSVEYFLAPGSRSQLFWTMALFIGVSCQSQRYEES
jgi:O-antigen ligase